MILIVNPDMDLYAEIFVTLRPKIIIAKSNSYVQKRNLCD